jgi:hypothetical protein
VADKGAAKARFEQDVLCAMDEYAMAEREAVNRLCQKGMATFRSTGIKWRNSLLPSK